VLTAAVYRVEFARSPPSAKSVAFRSASQRLRQLHRGGYGIEPWVATAARGEQARRPLLPFVGLGQQAAPASPVRAEKAEGGCHVGSEPVDLAEFDLMVSG
jgi:hypothetical protein